MSETTEPAGLKRVCDFINSLDLMPVLKDEWTDPAALAAWLREHGWVDGEVSATRADLARAVEVRESLRALTVANSGGELDPEALPRIQAAADRAGLAVRLRRGAGPLDPRRDGIDAALGRVLAVVAESLNDGTWV